MPEVASSTLLSDSNSNTLENLAQNLFFSNLNIKIKVQAMKKLILLIGFAVVFSTGAFAQKFAFIDSDYILENIPAFNAAQEQLDQLSQQYQKELESMYAEIEKMYQDFQAESVLLSEDMKRKREDVIISREKEYKDLQRKYFGPNGDLFKRRQTLVQPIQDDIFNAVQEIANEGSYAVIFDKAGGTTMLFTNPRFDLSDQVLQKLGYKN